MSTNTSERSRWMSDLALASPATLEAFWTQLKNDIVVQTLKGPQTGLVMLRARAGNTGCPFNLGEMSLTSCAVSVNEVLGQSWVAGMCPEHAKLAAIFDSLLQQQDYADAVTIGLLEPLRQERKQQLAMRRAESEPTRVDFFTLVRGED